MKHILKILISMLVFTSCGTMRFNKTSDFSEISNVKDLEGYYLNRVYGANMLSYFNVQEYADFVKISSENPNEIKLTYYNDSIKQERIFTGQMKGKYFEIYFSKKQFFIPIIISTCDIDRIRIGKSKDGKLLIKKFVDQSSNLLIMGGGIAGETPTIFPHAKEYKHYIPILENGLWGYSDTSGNIVIPPKYDFTSIFEHGVARVKLNNKWGLINLQGEEITTFKYDKISLIDTVRQPYIFRVYIGKKTGIVDANGIELIPVIYDEIGYFFSPDALAAIRLRDKWGYALRTRVVIPAIYSEIYSHYGWQLMVKRNKKRYIVDIEGYEYEAEGIWMKPIQSTARKVQLEEQEIE